tara:strand:+ start:357 stop:545 length:189 start_codon:yes stop_codon:yes gene_type:complete
VYFDLLRKSETPPELFVMKLYLITDFLTEAKFLEANPIPAFSSKSKPYLPVRDGSLQSWILS